MEEKKLFFVSLSEGFRKQNKIIWLSVNLLQQNHIILKFCIKSVLSWE